MKQSLLVGLGFVILGVIALVALILVNIEASLTYWIEIYNRTPPAATAFLFMAAAWSVHQNNTDKARWFVIFALWFAAGIYLVNHFDPAWWIVYGDSLMRLADSFVAISIFTLAYYRKHGRKHH